MYNKKIKKKIICCHSFRSENVTLMNVNSNIKCCLFAIYQSLSRAFNIFQVYQYFTIYTRYFVSVVCVKQYAPQNVVLVCHKVYHAHML